MKRLILSAFAAALLLFLMGTQPSFSQPRGAADLLEVRDISRDIQSLNLINSLYLTKDQMAKLIPLCEEAGRMESTGRSTYNKNGQDFIAVLKEMRTQLMSNADIPKDLKERYHKIHGRFKMMQVDNKGRMKELEKQAYGILNENQKVVLAEYKPCLVPRKNTVNPERIGQAGGGERIGELLERVRKVPADRYPAARKQILSRFSDKIKYVIPEEEGQKEIVAKLAQAMDDSRKLSDSEFAIKKDQMAESVTELKKAEKSKKKSAKKADEGYAVKFLLNPGVADILKQKMNVAGVN